MVRALIYQIQFRTQSATVDFRSLSFHLALDQPDLVIQPPDPELHHPVVRLRQELKHGEQQRSQWDEHDKHLLDQRRDPEWKIALQEWPSSFVEALRFLTERKINCLGRRELPRLLENPGLRMNLGGCVEKQILQRWMQISADGKAGLRRQQYDITGRPVRQKIDDPGRQYQFMQKRINGHKGIRA